METLTKINTREAGIFVFIGGFVVAILISSFVSISRYVTLLIFLLALAFLFGEKIYSKKISKEIFLLSIAFLSFGFGFLRYQYKDERNINQAVESKLGEKVVLEGIITDEPERKDNVTRIIMLPDGSKEKVLVNTDLYSHVSYGDRIEVSGKLQKPGNIKADDGRSFDYQAYLSMDGIYYTISFARVEKISGGNGNIIKSSLFRIKGKFIEEIRTLFSEPESSLMAGLILAGKESLPKNTLEEFRRAGIVHIVVLSGYNITIVAEFFLKIFSFLSLRIAATSAGVSVILFTLMTGAQATIVRAALMSLILLLGKIMGRGYSAPRALLVAGFFMLLENPKILVLDPSFQLSFLATLSLMYAVPIVDRYLSRVTDKGGLRSIIGTTLGTQVVVLPYILFSMGNFSVVALISNVATLVFIPITMLLGFIATLVGFVNEFIALPFTYISHLLLSWILFVGEKLGNLSWSSIEVRAFPLWIILLWYAIYFCIYIRTKSNSVSRAMPIYKNS